MVYNNKKQEASTMRQKEKEITNTREIETIIQKAGVCRLGLAVDNIGARYSILLSAIIMIPGIIIYSRIKDK